MKLERRSQRIDLSEPISGTFGNLPVLITDIGFDGAGFDHNGPLGRREERTLSVDSRVPVEVRARVCHQSLRSLGDVSSPARYHTGVVFIGHSEAVDAAIDSIVIDDIRQQVVEWEANLTGSRRSAQPSLGHSMRSHRPIGYLWYHFVDGTWTRTPSQDPNQPIDGFAVCDDEDPAQIALLCKTYERYNEDDRYVLRLIAHLAIAERRQQTAR